MQKNTIARGDVLDFIRNYQNEFKACPTMQDIGDSFGRTKQWASLVTDQLQDAGLLTKHKGSRSLRIVEQGVQNGN